MVISEETIKKREIEAEKRGELKGRLEGKLEGRLEGELEGKVKTLAELIKSGTISLSDAVNLGGVDRQKLERYMK